MEQGKVSLWGQAAAAVLFVDAFLSVNGSPLADSIRFELIFKYMVIPFYQWLVVLCFIVLWKYAASMTWGRALAGGAIVGLAACLFLPMFDTQRQVWLGTPLSRIYVLYINSFVFAATSAVLLGGTFAVRGVVNRIYSPLILFSMYGAYFYVSNGHWQAAAALIFEFACFTWLASNKALLASIGSFVKSAVSRLSDTKTLILLLFIFAFALRMVFFFNLLSIEGARYPLASDDGDTYDLYGVKGAADPMIFLRESPHYFWVFYSVFLAAVYKIFGHSYVAAGIIQSAIGALLCCLVFMLAYRITALRQVAVLASLGVCIDPRLIHLTTTLNTEVLYIPFLVAVIYLLLCYKVSAKGSRALALLILAGFVLGLAAVLRTVGAGLALFVLPWMLLGGRGYTARVYTRRFRDCALFAAAMAMAIGPITYTNYRNTHKFYLVYDTKDAVEWKVPSPRTEDLVPSNKRLIALGMVDPVNAPLESLKAVCARPADFIRAYCEIIPKRVRNLYLWPGYGFFDPVSLINSAKLPSRFAHHLEFYTFVLMLLGFPVFIFSRIRWSVKSLALLVLIYYTLLHGVAFLSYGPRYGAPMKPFLYVICAYALYKISEAVRPKLP